MNNAREFKLDSQLGRIEPGKIANLVLLKKSSLESVDAMIASSRFGFMEFPSPAKVWRRRPNS